MDYRKIARTILGADNEDNLLLTDEQISYLAESIDELPDEQSDWLISYGTFDTEIDEFGEKIFATLSNNLQLRAILSLGAMSTSDLIDMLVATLSGKYAISIESNSPHSHQIIFEHYNAKETSTDNATIPASNSCKLQALFGAEIGNDYCVSTNSPYLDALKVFREKFGPQQPVALSGSCYIALRHYDIITNADLLRWHNEDSLTRKHIPGIGKKRLEQIKEYIEFWFSTEKKRLLQTTAPH